MTTHWRDQLIELGVVSKDVTTSLHAAATPQEFWGQCRSAPLMIWLLMVCDESPDLSENRRRLTLMACELASPLWNDMPGLARACLRVHELWSLGLFHRSPAHESIDFGIDREELDALRISVAGWLWSSVQSMSVLPRANIKAAHMAWVVGACAVRSVSPMEWDCGLLLAHPVQLIEGKTKGDFVAVDVVRRWFPEVPDLALGVRVWQRLREHRASKTKTGESPRL